MTVTPNLERRVKEGADTEDERRREDNGVFTQRAYGDAAQAEGSDSVKDSEGGGEEDTNEGKGKQEEKVTTRNYG